jgi:ceramide glucosyltransferase
MPALPFDLPALADLPLNTPALVLLAIPAVGGGLYLLAWMLCLSWLGWHRWRSAGRRLVTRNQGVSILKPLCGADDELGANLASFFALDHEPLQLIFGAADADDPGLVLVRQLARRHPDRDVTIIVGANAAAASPKVGLMERLLPHATHEIILLSDSNVRVAPDEIRRVLPCFDDPRVGMAYQAVVGVGEHSAAAACENLHYTEWAGLIAIGTTMLSGEHVVNAKGQWVRRAALATIDDFAQVRDSAADDYQLAQAVLAAGWRIALAPHRVRIVHRDWSWTSLFQRHLRHAGLRRRICPWAYPFELLLNPVTWALAVTAAGLPLVALPLAAMKYACELSAARLLRGVPLALRHAVLLPFKDLLYFVGWFGSFSARTVSWRGRTYALGRHAQLIPLDPPLPELAAEPLLGPVLLAEEIAPAAGIRRAA